MTDWSDTIDDSLTEEQEYCLQAIVRHGVLRRADGGFWTRPQLATKVDRSADKRPPPWHYGTRTVRGLVRRGLAEVNRKRTLVRPTPRRTQIHQ